MNLVASEPALIGIDWGTSSLRAFLIGQQGDVLDGVSSPEGIMQVAGQTFEACPLSGFSGELRHFHNGGSGSVSV